MAKTSMQQLKEKLQSVCNTMNVDDNWDTGYKAALGYVIMDIDAQMLAIEKQQIIDAHVGRFMNQTGINAGLLSTGEQYYSETFPS